MDPKDNGAVAPEAASAPTPEPSVATAAQGSETGVQEPESKVNAQDANLADLDPVTLHKELEKARMEANLHKNKVKEFERKAEEARKAELSEVERLREELAEYQQKESRRDAEHFRNTVIEDYLKDNPVALKAAKALIAKNPANLVWGPGENGETATEEEARLQLHAQLDALVEVLGTQGNPAAPEAPAKKSAPRSSNPRGTDAPSRAELIAKARETGDFTGIIGSLPSFRAQHLATEE